MAMPPGNPITNLFAVAFEHTTGVQADIWTVATVGVSLFFIMIGYFKVCEALGSLSEEREREQAEVSRKAARDKKNQDRHNDWYDDWQTGARNSGVLPQEKFTDSEEKYRKRKGWL